MRVCGPRAHSSPLNTSISDCLVTHFALPDPAPPQNCYINVPSQCAFNYPMLSNPAGHNVYCQCCQVSCTASAAMSAVLPAPPGKRYYQRYSQCCRVDSLSSDIQLAIVDG